jgi:hypothetical protein
MKRDRRKQNPSGSVNYFDVWYLGFELALLPIRRTLALSANFPAKGSLGLAHIKRWWRRSRPGGIACFDGSSRPSSFRAAPLICRNAGPALHTRPSRSTNCLATKTESLSPRAKGIRPPNRLTSKSIAFWSGSSKIEVHVNDDRWKIPESGAGKTKKLNAALTLTISP